ncbi:MAG: LPS assembly protein LptD [Ignavibacteriaceae bacterium]
MNKNLQIFFLQNLKSSFVFIIIISFCVLTNVNAQDIDTIASPLDTLFTASSDTLQPDTAGAKRYDVDTTIFASSNDSIIFLLDKKEMLIYGSSELEYKQTQLKSANIFVDFETSDILAEGILSDTVPGVVTGTPVLSEQGEVYKGASMKYNFKTGRGLISSAGTESEGAYYTGSKINKVDPETYFIEDGIFTTCEDSVPHYHFYSPEMKVIHKKQIVAKWIWLFFGGVPFPVPLPFAVFPIESGRRSGILPPAFGQDARYGYYFSRFGYFWAISDYMDWNVTVDYFTRGSYNLNSRFRYSKRYSYTGNLEGGYSFRKGSESGDPDYSRSIDWRMRWNHNQTIDPTLRFDANLEYASGSDFFQQNVADLSQNLRRDIYSSATLFKSWDESGNSLSLGYSRRQNLDEGDISEVLPSLSFNMSQKYPFRTESTKSTNLKWFEMIGYQYRSQLENRRDKTDGHLKIRGGVQHNVSINASPKIGYISITPNISYQEKWYNKKTIRETGSSPETGNDTILTRDVNQINMLRTFSLGMSAQTRFFGIVNPDMLGVSSIRHTVTPSVSYIYTPDFSKSFWGYYEEYVDTAGSIVRYDPYSTQIFQGVSSYESQVISFSVGNIFEMKTTVDPTDTTSKENKIQLLNVDAGLSYNFTAPEFNFSDLRLNYRTQIGEWLNFSGGSNFSLYDYDDVGNRINKLLVDQGKGLLRLTNFNFTISTSLSADRLRTTDKNQQATDETEDQYQLGQADRAVYKGLYEEKEADFTIPWNLSLNYNFSQNQANPYRKTVFSNISGSVDFNLTPAWKFSFTGSYDFKNGEFAAPQVRISRDLHCWIMNFTWNPIGTYRGYRLEIRVKAPQLQDLKITKRDQFYSGK